MFYKRFTFLVIIRVIFLLVNVIIISIIFGDTRLFFNQIILSLILILQVIELIRFVNHTNRELSRLFLAIRHDDFAITFKQPSLGKSFSELQTSMIEIIQAYKEVKIEREAQYHFLQMLMRQIQIGIIAVKDEEITLINPTAEEMLQLHGPISWRLITQNNFSFIKEIEQLGDNGRKLIELKREGETKFLSVDVRTLIILDRPQKLITFQDINSEIEQKEIEAWHKLIRILTHEIMNSVTPISSLTETMQSLLQDKNGDQKELKNITTETISDIRFSLNTIQKRSDGLLNFIENYRKLTKVPQPKVERVNVKSLFGTIENLFSQELNKKNISLAIDAKDDLTIMLDRMLIEQVMINLITNSIHALEKKNDPKIELIAFQQDKNTIIHIHDNGKGIAEKELREIFVPFFSTKKEGSGIGLSLSKQIMSLHGGTIKVKSEINSGTSFYLHFRN
jgi:two-component system nitrogen regulation sensor histidine kinase NtrY